MFGEDSLIPVSSLQHYMVCPRQCALIHVEQQWVENRLTAEGRVMHAKAHSNSRDLRQGVLVTRGLHIRSLELGLVGIADIVEFHLDESETYQGSVVSSLPPGRPYPVEYKRGRPKAEPWDEVQLCAQAICLEEMLNRAVPSGSLFYGQTRKRLDVVFDNQLRALTVKTALAVHAMIEAGVTPAAVPSSVCRSCSFARVCRPDGLSKSVRHYILRNLGAP